MFYLAHTCETPAADLGLDEALLERAETGNAPLEVLRIWEARTTAVVIGRSSSLSGEVNVEECSRRSVPILRRTSGGAAVVIGPGCLMFSVVLSFARRPHLRAIDEAHRFVLSRVLEAIRPIVPEAMKSGTSDLAVGDRKFSGNSLRCRREHLLYHGTLLHDFPLATIGELLRTPPRQPQYRAGRSHGDFVTNVPIDPATLEKNLRGAFGAAETLNDLPTAEAERWAADKFGNVDWTAHVP